MNEFIEPGDASLEQANQSEIKEIEGGFEILIPHVELDSGKEPAVKLEIELEKLPIQITEGSTIGAAGGVIVDIESSPSPKLKEMVGKAKELRDIPEAERPRKIMEIIRAKVNYAYDEVVENLKQTDPELADWVVKHAGMHSTGEVKASEIADSGHGICRHLAALAIILGKEAGLGASFETNVILKDEDGFMNVMRKDNGKQLFKSYKPGERFNAFHAWAQSRLSDGSWIPMDPTTKLVGDNEPELEMFREANYKSIPGYGLSFGNLPPSVSSLGLKNLQFVPGEISHRGVVEINCVPEIKIGLDPEETTETPRLYSGPLNFQIISQPTTEGMNVRVKSVKIIS